jgi:hypothetical protein
MYRLLLQYIFIFYSQKWNSPLVSFVADTASLNTISGEFLTVICTELQEIHKKNVFYIV